MFTTKKDIYEFLNSFKVSLNNNFLIVTNAYNYEYTSDIFIKLGKSYLGFKPCYAICEDLNKIPVSICKENENDYILCFGVTLNANETVKFSFTDGNYDLTEELKSTVKIADGEYYQLTSNDNGSCIITAKNSGNMIFESPSFLVKDVGSDSVSFNTFAFTEKQFSLSFVVFKSIIPFYNILRGEMEKSYISSDIFYGKNSDFIIISADFSSLKSDKKGFLRIPSGAYDFTCKDDNCNIYDTNSKIQNTSEITVFSSDNTEYFKLSSFYDYDFITINYEGNIDIHPKNNDKLLLKIKLF